LADELDEAVKKVSSKQLDRRDAVGDLSGAVYEKDEATVLDLIKEWISDQLDRRIRVRLRLAARELEREADDAADASRQLGFDDVCSYFFPEDTFPPSTLLSEAMAWAYDLLGRAERHHKIATDRVQFAERMLAAVDGNSQASLGEAVTALRESGDAAAEG
jgi:hypothetical protein